MAVFVKLLLLFFALHGQTELAVAARVCSSSGAVSNAATTTCTLGDLASCQGTVLTGQILVTGSDSKFSWDLSASGDGTISVGEGSNVTLSCMSISLESEEGFALRPPSLDTLLLPPFIQTPDGVQPIVNMLDVELVVNCGLLLEWEYYLCGERLPGPTEVQGSRVDITDWSTQYAHLERVRLTCSPGSDGAFVPACAMATVGAVEEIRRASEALQDPNLPLVLTLSNGLDFRDSSWPDDGLRITANVTLSATLGSMVPISFGLRTVLFQVDSKSSSTAFLSFRGCILLDLPLSYLPLDHPRRPFGVLSTGLWPVYREQVAMGLYNCTLILTREEFLFWSFWLSILVSPIPTVRDLASWSYASGVQLEPSGEDYIQLASYYGRYTTLVNVRYQVSNDVYYTQQRNNILQITGDAQVPPTVVYQVKDSDDLASAFAKASSSPSKQYGQYIILTNNLSLSTSVSGQMTISYPTTVTTWPATAAAMDFQAAQNAFLLLGSITMKGIVLLNLGTGPNGDDYAGLATGIWAFNISNWRALDQQRILLESVALVVTQQEVDYYLASTVNSDGKGANPWVSAFKVGSYDTTNRTWVYFDSLATSRFAGQNVNITSCVPQAFDSIPITAGGGSDVGISLGPEQHRSSGTKRGEVLLFALLAITLPTALGASLLTFLFLKRRRLSQMCTRSESSGKQQQKKESLDMLCSQDDAEEDVEGARPSQTDFGCCIRLPLPLRKSKFVNPLYEDPGTASQEVVLTEVLGTRRLPPPASRRDAPPLSYLGTGDVATPTSAGSAAASPRILPRSGDADRQDAMVSSSEDELQGVSIQVDTAVEPSPGHGSSSPRAEQVAPVLLQLLAMGEAADGGSTTGGWRSSGARSRTTGQAAAGSGTSAASAVLPLLPLPHLDNAMAETERRLDGAGGHSAFFRHQQAGERADGTAAEAPPAVAVVDAGQAAADVERRSSGGQGAAAAALQPAALDPRLPEMQRLEQLRREIGDRHLEVHHSLGWGGCAVVYKGTWKGLQVAVKTLLVQGDSKQSRQFLTEAAISASLQHANIVTTYLYELRPLDEVDMRPGSSRELRLHSTDVTRSGDVPSELEPMSCWKLYIVQEYCELGTLKAAIDQGYFKGPRGGLPNMAFLLTIAADVSMGLVHVHSKDVVHGDITVSNVLLQTAPGRPQGCIAKLADFGLSIKLESGQPHLSHMYGGTPHYMAPERARGMLSKPCDIYSLGVLLWELYRGTPPWRKHAGAHNRRYGGDPNSFGSSVDSGSHGQLPWLEAQQRSADSTGVSDSLTLPRNCPPEYASLVRSCLASDPKQRPTAAAVVEALQGIQRRYV